MKHTAWVVLLSITLLSCGGGNGVSSGGSTNQLQTVNPGSTFPLGATVLINSDGPYIIPNGASILTTRCFGTATVAIPGTPPQTNTCSSPDGSSSMTNSVTGVGAVTYTFSTGSSAQVTVN